MTRSRKNPGASGIRTPGSSALEADALTTRPTRRSKGGEEEGYREKEKERVEHRDRKEQTAISETETERGLMLVDALWRQPQTEGIRVFMREHSYHTFICCLRRDLGGGRVKM